jgi:hypothetical protein
METACAQCIALYMSVSRLTVDGLLCLHYKEAPRMARGRCTDVQACPAECLDVTSYDRRLRAYYVIVIFHPILYTLSATRGRGRRECPAEPRH